MTTRYAPQHPFPPYAYLPGRNPHPTRHPAGHSHGEAPAPDSPHLPARDWGRNGEYLFAVDLYNHGYLWEAHEAWEGLWHPAKGDRLVAEHLQGLIQCAAAALKLRMGQPQGLAKLAERGTARLEGVAREAGPRFMGIDLEAFVAAFRAFAASRAPNPGERPRIELGYD